jgi:tetratricopeptide (TPR) repeat protein
LIWHSIRVTFLGLVVLAGCGQLFAQEPENSPPQPTEADLKQQQMLQARQAEDAGMEALQAGHYQQAIEHFKNALFLDEGLFEVKVKIAVAYEKQYVPGNESDDNLRMAQQAITAYKEVLQQDSRSLESLKGIGRLYTQTGSLGDAIETYKQLIEIASDDPEPYFHVGMIDWTLAYADTEQRKSMAGLQADDFMDGPENEILCGVVVEANQARVQEGLKMLQAAIERRRDYPEAFGYMALLYRREADLACDDRGTRAAKLKLSEEWADRALAARKTKAEGAVAPKSPATNQPKP